MSKNKGSHSDSYYTGGSNAVADFEVIKDGYQTGRIKGEWEDAMRKAVPNHSERNWNHAGQMTAKEGTTDGFLDTQAEIDAAAKWLNENSPGNEEVKPEEPKQDNTPSQALTRARAYVAQKDFSDMVGETTQSKFGYNPVSGNKGFTRETDGKGIASNFMEQYQTRVKDLNYEVNPDQTASGQLRADATGQGPIVGLSTQTPESQKDENAFLKHHMSKVGSTPINEQAQDTLGMP